MLRSLYDSIIYVKVGSEQQSFGLHKALLCQRSAYFKAALNGNFKEAEDGIVGLNDEDPHLFQIFNQWLYTGALLFDSQDLDPDEKNSAQWSAMLNLYVFAEKRVIPRLQNDLIDTMWKFFLEDYFPAIEVIPAWDQTAKSSPLHAFLVDLYVFHGNLEHLFHEDSDIAMSFHVDFAMRVAKESNALAFSDGDRTKDFSMWNNRCQYHVHDSSEPLCEGGDQLGLLRPGQ